MLWSLAIVAAVSAVVLNTGNFVSADAGATKEYRGDRQAIHAAVEAADYTLLSEAAQEKISVEKFAEMQAHRAEMVAHLAELEEVVKNNDLTWFVALLEEKKADKEAKRAEKLAELETTNPEKFAKIQEKMENRTEKTEEEKAEKIQEKFVNMTDYYAANGELPTMKKGKKWHGAQKWMRAGMRNGKGFGGKRGR